MNLDHNNTVTDQWYLHSIHIIQLLQTRFQPYEWWIVQTSVFGDNRQAFAYFFPLFAALVSILGAKVLWAAIFTEWLNLILKWLFIGERPYWWVHETPLFADDRRPMLRQFPNTCETGPGTPSGHIMMNVALFYVVTRGLSKFFIWNSRRHWCLKLLLSLLLFATYAIWIAAVYVSRLYIQAHFIHQCTAGVLCGLLVGQFAWKSRSLMRMRHLGSYFVALFLFGSSSAAYYGLQYFGANPLWSIELATKYCVNSEYIMLYTQPFYAIVRFTASALGLGYGLSSKYRKNSSSPNAKGLSRFIIAIIIGLSLGKGMSYALVKIPTEDVVIYYSSVFALHLIFPYLIIALVPYMLNSFYSTK